jgi:hypothetical protein
MKTVITLTAAMSLSLVAMTGMAETTRDCLLEGTVQKGSGSDSQGVSVKINSVGKYDQDSSCRVRPGQKMEFKLPADPRVQGAEDGSAVKYRYRTESDGTTRTDLVSVGT